MENKLVEKTMRRKKWLELTQEERRKVLCIAREQILSQCKIEEMKKEINSDHHPTEFIKKIIRIIKRILFGFAFMVGLFILTFPLLKPYLNIMMH